MQNKVSEQPTAQERNPINFLVMMRAKTDLQESLPNACFYESAHEAISERTFFGGTIASADLGAMLT